MHTLFSHRLCLEPMREKHAELMFRGLQQVDAYRYIPDLPPETVDDVRRRYRMLEQQRSPCGTEVWLNWAVRDKNVAHYFGYVQATLHRKTKEALIAYLIFPQFWRKGRAKEAVHVVLDDLFERWNMEHIKARIDTRNMPSIALVTSLGFVFHTSFQNADYFKGQASHENHYILLRQTYIPPRE